MNDDVLVLISNTVILSDVLTDHLTEMGMLFKITQL